jgi:hypothetical protein
MANLLFHTEKLVPGTVDQIARGIREIVLGEGTHKFAIYVSDPAANTFVQFWSDDETATVRAEVTSNRYRAPEHRLTDAQERYLAGLGWLAPVPGGSPNHHRDFAVASEEDARLVAREAFRALEIYGYRVGTPLFETITRQRKELPGPVATDAAPAREGRVERVLHLGYEGGAFELEAAIVDGEPVAFFFETGGPTGWEDDDAPPVPVIRHGPLTWEEMLVELDRNGWLATYPDFVHPAIATLVRDAIDARWRSTAVNPLWLRVSR